MTLYSGEFANRRVLVTGAASGIGAATASLFSELGAEVIGIDVNALDETRFAECYRCDLGNEEDISNTLAALGTPVDVLCNVAGLPGSHSARRVMSVNVLGLRALTEALLPRLADGGSVVNVASGAGAGWQEHLSEISALLRTEDFAAGLAWCDARTWSGPQAYNFSKEVVIVYSMLIAAREFHRGVRVNSLSPGAVETAILADFYATMDEDILERLRQRSGGRHGKPAEIAPAIIFLASRAARWVNGADLPVDGGAEAALKLAEYI